MQLTPHAEELLKKSYYRKDKDGNVMENWEGLCRRVANHIAKGDYCDNYIFSIVNMGIVPCVDYLYNRKNEKDKQCCGTCRNYNTCAKVKEIEDKFYDLLYNQYFIVNTPSLMNSGTDLGGLSACFIIAIEDSMESILNAVKQMGIILKTGGGVGFSFGKVRQKGAKIGSTGGVSSGVISWLKIFNQVVEEVKQGGRRRGAGSCVLPVHHPDIIEYLTCKTDNTVITNFNLSVGVTDEFMSKVKNNENYNLIEPHTEKIVGQLNAKEVFDIICNQAFLNGEPGLFFLDTVNKDNPVPKSGNIYSGNPCILNDTLFITKGRGIQRFEHIDIGEEVWTGKQWSPLINKWSTGIKPVFRYSTSNGYYIDCTENHQIVQNGEKIEIQYAESIDKSLCTANFGGFSVSEDEAILAGLVLGDGSMQKNGGKCSYLNVGKKDEDHKKFVNPSHIDKILTYEEGKCDQWKLKFSFEDLHLNYAPIWDRTISEFWINTNSKTMHAFLKGLFSANGSVIKSAQRVALKTSNKILAKQVQAMLSSLGLSSYITTNKPSTIKWDNGVYTSRESYDVNISDTIKFKQTIGFTQQYKMDAISDNKKEGRKNTTASIISSEYLGDMEVFDFTVEAAEHTVWANGLLISNCFEFVLPPYNSCTLGAINLSKIIDIERWGDGTPLVRAVENVKVVDYELFDSIISTAVRMLDNTITMNKFPIPEIEEVTLANRPIGLGFLNLSELFIKLGLVYGSNESLEMAATVTSYMHKKAIETSIELAKERGSYPNFDATDWYNVNKKYIESGTIPPVRNSTVLSIAPNGSTGVIVNASSGGVEPIFAVSYKRKTVDCGDMHMVNPLFEELMEQDNKGNGCAWKTGGYENMLSKIEDNAGSVEGILDVPEKIQKLFVTAREIPYEQHIKMQAAVQRHVDLSISKTVNLLSDATVEDVKNAYTMAHALGCKGITIYREGSRENEVLSTKKKENQHILFELKDQPNNYNDAINTAKALGIDTDKLGKPIEEDTYPEDDDFMPEVRERRDPVIGYTYKIGIHNLKIYITVNFNSDELTPIECFIAAGKPGDDINAITQSISRLVSLGLKFKIPIDEIINQLDSLAGEDIVWMGGGKILSVPDAVAKVLKWAMEKRSADFVIKDPKIVTVKGPSKQYTNSTFTMFSKTNCPNCGDTLIFQEGCKKCLSCDYNKCG